MLYVWLTLLHLSLLSLLSNLGNVQSIVLLFNFAQVHDCISVTVQSKARYCVKRARDSTNGMQQRECRTNSSALSSRTTN